MSCSHGAIQSHCENFGLPESNNNAQGNLVLYLCVCVCGEEGVIVCVSMDFVK